MCENCNVCCRNSSVAALGSNPKRNIYTFFKLCNCRLDWNVKRTKMNQQRLGLAKLNKNYNVHS